MVGVVVVVVLLVLVFALVLVHIRTSTSTSRSANLTTNTNSGTVIGRDGSSRRRTRSRRLFRACAARQFQVTDAAYAPTDNAAASPPAHAPEQQCGKD